MPIIFRRPEKVDHEFETRLLTVSRRAGGTVMELLRQTAPTPLPKNPRDLEIHIRPNRFDICVQSSAHGMITYQPYEVCRSGEHSLFLLDYGNAFIGRWVSEDVVSVLPVCFDTPTKVRPADGSEPFVLWSRISPKCGLVVKIKTAEGSKNGVALNAPDHETAIFRFDVDFRHCLRAAFKLELAAMAKSIEEDLDRNARSDNPAWPAALCDIMPVTPGAEDEIKQVIADCVDVLFWRGLVQVGSEAEAEFYSRGIVNY